MSYEYGYETRARRHEHYYELALWALPRLAVILIAATGVLFLIADWANPINRIAAFAVTVSGVLFVFTGLGAMLCRSDADHEWFMAGDRAERRYREERSAR